jgi:hypothetical protein
MYKGWLRFLQLKWSPYSKLTQATKALQEATLKYNPHGSLMFFTSLSQQLLYALLMELFPLQQQLSLFVNELPTAIYKHQGGPQLQAIGLPPGTLPLP